jgi:hypothetical protein
MKSPLALALLIAPAFLAAQAGPPVAKPDPLKDRLDLVEKLANRKK